MGRKTGIGLTAIQSFSRSIQFSSAVLILGIYSYFLAVLKNHHFPIATSIRAVEGISGIGALYALIRLLFFCLCCCCGVGNGSGGGGGAGALGLSVVGGLLDLAFVAGFIYVAVVNKGGAGTCQGIIDTPFGKGSAETTVHAARGFTSLPSFRIACQLQTASLVVAIIAIFFFLVSIVTEIGLVRHHNRESRRYSVSIRNALNSNTQEKPRTGIFASWSSFARHRAQPLPTTDNMLPEHAHPDQLDPLRPSYASDSTHTTYDPGYAKYETGYGYHGHDSHGSAYESLPPQPYLYDDGIYDRH